MTFVQAISEALRQAQTRAHTPAAVPIPSHLFLQSSPYPPGLSEYPPHPLFSITPRSHAMHRPCIGVGLVRLEELDCPYSTLSRMMLPALYVL